MVMTHILTVAIEITLKKIEGIEGSDFFNKSNISTHLKSGRPYVHLRSDGPRPILG